MLRVDLERSSLVFRARRGAAFLAGAEPVAAARREPRADQGATLARAEPEGTVVQASKHPDGAVGRRFSIEVPLGAEEGAYDVSIAAVHTPQTGSRPCARPLNWKKTVAERSVQVVVVGPRPAAARGQVGSRPQPRSKPSTRPIREWWDALAKLKIPALSKGPLGNGNSRTWKHPLGEMVRLKPQRRFARRELGGLYAAVEPSGAAAHRRGRVSQRRAADVGHQRAGGELGPGR